MAGCAAMRAQSWRCSFDVGVCVCVECWCVFCCLGCFVWREINNALPVPPPPPLLLLAPHPLACKRFLCVCVCVFVLLN